MYKRQGNLLSSILHMESSLEASMLFPRFNTISNNALVMRPALVSDQINAVVFESWIVDRRTFEFTFGLYNSCQKLKSTFQCDH